MAMVNELEKILGKCDFEDTLVLNENNVCMSGFHPNHCPYLLYFEDVNYCKSVLVVDNKKQIEYSKWLEK